MASHGLSNAKTTILGATLGAIPRNGGNPIETFSFAPAFSEHIFKNWGGPRAPDFLSGAQGGRNRPTATRFFLFSWARADQQPVKPIAVAWPHPKLQSRVGHFLRGRSLKGRCNICVYVPVCVCVCSCVCPSSPPSDPTHAVGLNSRIPPHTPT